MIDNEIEILFLGSGTITPDPHRFCSSTLIQGGGQQILIDIGPGALRQMAISGVDPHQINHLFLTHYHPDHVSDLLPFLFMRKHGRPQSGAVQLKIWGPEGLLEFVRHMTAAYGDWVQPESDLAIMQELEDAELTIDGFLVSWRPVVHYGNCIGYRFEIGGKAIAFSGDTEYCPPLIELAEKADLAVLECASADAEKRPRHMSATDIQRLVAEAKPVRVAINHCYPEALADNPAEKIGRSFSGEVIMATDGLWLIV